MVNRITGFSNVFDIDEIVSKLMKTEQAPLDKMTRQKQTLEWQRDSYREVNSKVKELDDLINKLNLTLPSTYGAKKSQAPMNLLSQQLAQQMLLLARLM